MFKANAIHCIKTELLSLKKIYKKSPNRRFSNKIVQLDFSLNKLITCLFIASKVVAVVVGQNKALICAL